MAGRPQGFLVDLLNSASLHLSFKGDTKELKQGIQVSGSLQTTDALFDGCLSLRPGKKEGWVHS